MGYNFLNIDSSNWTISLYMADYSFDDDDVDTFRSCSDWKNLVMILTGQVDGYDIEAQTYRGRLSSQSIFPRIYDLACQSLAQLALVIR